MDDKWVCYYLIKRYDILRDKQNRNEKLLQK